jgi:hypothetical protein
VCTWSDHMCCFLTLCLVRSALCATSVWCCGVLVYRSCGIQCSEVSIAAMRVSAAALETCTADTGQHCHMCVFMLCCAVLLSPLRWPAGILALSAHVGGSVYSPVRHVEAQLRSMFCLCVDKCYTS